MFVLSRHSGPSFRFMFNVFAFRRPSVTRVSPRRQLLSRVDFPLNFGSVLCEFVIIVTPSRRYEKFDDFACFQSVPGADSVRITTGCDRRANSSVRCSSIVARTTRVSQRLRPLHRCSKTTFPRQSDCLAATSRFGDISVMIRFLPPRRFYYGGL